ncbi:uncharacterized protein LOC128549841 [Mercenaria mercenaria]|uniref:uncharacterized protein LOC128549841 n=1 Tax=Mercenaria mercenaria TaxID=6596 RepID=UPI00234E8B71|nr:uncharacterized protein LOC128549841 [Mercenaria mercenaria]
MEAIETFCHQKNLDMQNIRFVGLDGCNTMSGERKGLQRRIRHASPFSLYINCRNHRLALCFVHMMKKGPLLVEVDATLISIWKMFHFSPKKAATFKNMQEAYGQRPLAFVRASTTRWLSHLSACLRFTARFESLLDTIDALVYDSHDADILGIRNHMMRQEFVATVLVLSDMLRPVNYLSLYLQEDCGTFTELPGRVQQCLDDLESISSRYQQHNLQDLEFRKCQEMFDVITERTALAMRVRLGRRNEEMTPEGFLRDTGIPMIYTLKGEIQDAFSIHSAVLASFALLDPKNLPDDVIEVGTYGMEKG